MCALNYVPNSTFINEETHALAAKGGIVLELADVRSHGAVPSLDLTRKSDRWTSAAEPPRAPLENPSLLGLLHSEESKYVRVISSTMAAVGGSS